MALNGINQISSQNKWANVNIQSLEEITNKILERSQTKVQNPEIDYSKFRRVDQGIDLYNGKTNVELQRQIATNNSTLNTINIDTKYLNAQAASLLYSSATRNIANNLEGRMTIGVNENKDEQIREVTPLPKSTEVFNTANLSKDRRGSNPFATYTSVQTQEHEAETSLDILS